MRNYIIADNQELTAYALQSLLKRDEGSAIFRAVDRSGLTELLKERFWTIPCLTLPTRTNC